MYWGCTWGLPAAVEAELLLRLLGAGVGLSGVFTRGSPAGSSPAAGSPSPPAAAASAVPGAAASSGGTGFSGSPVEKIKNIEYN